MARRKAAKQRYHITYPILLAIVVTAGVFFAVVQSQKEQNVITQASVTNCTISASQLTIKTQEQQLLDTINAYRIQNGDSKLIWNSTLKQSATWQSIDMLTHNTLSHTDSLGRTPDVRLTDCGYTIIWGYGEAIADGSANAQSVFEGWKNDPAHNQLLLDKRFTLTGIDMEENAAGTSIYWTMDFGLNPPNTSVPTITSTIVSNAPTTAPTTHTVPTVSLSPSASDMIISVSAKIDGIGQNGNSTPKNKTRTITAYVFGSGSSPLTSGTGSLTYDGSNYFTGKIDVGPISPGSYFIKIKGDTTLQVLAQPALQKLSLGKTNIIPPVTLYPGDLNGDNVLDINDYNLALPCFQSKNCTDTTKDFNNDGEINVLDYNLFLQAYQTVHGD